MGSFRQDEISVWNDSTQWTPTEIEGKILTFNLQSNGQFLIFDNSRRLVFDFRNEMNQDFTIEKSQFSYDIRDVDDYEAANTVYGTYIQRVLSFGETTYGGVVVFSRGTDLDDLDVRLEGATLIKRTKRQTTQFIQMHTYADDATISVYVGNVLVAYMPRS